eukprot:COSAG05_NODE_1667_length_4310_cov_3.574210_5_plen_215_part_00
MVLTAVWAQGWSQQRAGLSCLTRRTTLAATTARLISMQPLKMAIMVWSPQCYGLSPPRPHCTSSRMQTRCRRCYWQTQLSAHTAKTGPASRQFSGGGRLRHRSCSRASQPVETIQQQQQQQQVCGSVCLLLMGFNIDGEVAVSPTWHVLTVRWHGGCRWATESRRSGGGSRSGAGPSATAGLGRPCARQPPHHWRVPAIIRHSFHIVFVNFRLY